MTTKCYFLLAILTFNMWIVATQLGWASDNAAFAGSAVTLLGFTIMGLAKFEGMLDD